MVQSDVFYYGLEAIKQILSPVAGLAFVTQLSELVKDLLDSDSFQLVVTSAKRLLVFHENKSLLQLIKVTREGKLNLTLLLSLYSFLVFEGQLI